MKNKIIKIQIGETILDVIGIYTPYYAGVYRRSDGSGEPPEPAEFDIQQVLIGKVDVTSMFHELDLWDKLEEKCLKEINN